MDGLEQEQDTSSQGDSSVAVKETSTETPETLTQEQIVDKAVSDALSKAGRDAKALNELQKKVDDGVVELTAKQSAWQKERDEAEEYELRDQPEELTAMRSKRAQAKAEAAKTTELDERVAKADARDVEFAEVIERDKVINRTELASKVALDKKVSVDLILRGVVLSKDDSREGMEAVAELLPKTEELPVLLIDNSRTNRGGDVFSSEDPKATISEGFKREREKLKR